MLEGHDLIEGWHFYIWFNVEKKNTQFKKHLVRRALLKVWNTIKYKTYRKTPLWVTPIEAQKHQNMTDWQKIKTYKDFVRSDGTLMAVQELEESQIKMTWWERLQLQTQYKKDKKGEFYLKPTPLDEIFLGKKEK